MSSEADELNLTFKTVVNHFDMKRNSKTSGELIRSSFSLEKSSKKFVSKVCTAMMQVQYNADMARSELGWVKEFTEVHVRGEKFIF